MRRLKHAVPAPKTVDEETLSLGRLLPTGAMPGGACPEERSGPRPPSGVSGASLAIRAPAAGARYPSRRTLPPGSGAGDPVRPRSTLTIVGILALGFVMLALAGALMARDLFGQAFAQAAVAADMHPSVAVRPVEPVPDRRS